MAEYDWLIVGSGLCGAVFAHEMKRRGKRCLVVEKREHTGGNIATRNEDGIVVHQYGAHIFHTNDAEVWQYVNALVPFNRYTNCPVANYKGKIYNLPFNMNTFYQMWGTATPQEAEAQIAQQREEALRTIGGAPNNLEEQALLLVGRDIYDQLIKGYTEKQWGRPATELPAFIIRRLPLRFTYDNNYFNDAYQGIPTGGYSRLTDALLDGVEVRTNVDFLADRAHWLNMADRVFYTGMMDAYFDYRLGQLEYRSLRFETEKLNIPNYQGNAVVNYTDAAVPYTRIIEHKHFEFGQQASTIITREYPEVWTPGKEAYYAVNDAKNEQLADAYRTLASQESRTVFCGRLAEYKYYNMDQVIRRVLDLVGSIN